MTLDAISRAIKETYNLSTKDILSGKVELHEVGQIVLGVSSVNGRTFFPDALHDSKYKRYEKVHEVETALRRDLRETLNLKRRIKPAVRRFIELAESNNLIPWKYCEFIPHTDKDNVYSPNTIKQAKAYDSAKHGSIPRLMKLESAGTRKGELHNQGIVLFPKGYKPDKSCYKRLKYKNLSKGVVDMMAYLSKPAGQRVEKDMKTNRLLCPFELALYEIGLWYVQNQRNKENHRKTGKKTQYKAPSQTWQFISDTLPNWFNDNSLSLNGPEIKEISTMEKTQFNKTRFNKENAKGMYAERVIQAYLISQDRMPLIMGHIINGPFPDFDILSLNTKTDKITSLEIKSDFSSLPNVPIPIWDSSKNPSDIILSNWSETCNAGLFKTKSEYFITFSNYYGRFYSAKTDDLKSYLYENPALTKRMRKPSYGERTGLALIPRNTWHKVGKIHDISHILPWPVPDSLAFRDNPALENVLEKRMHALDLTILLPKTLQAYGML
ncbi:hypothetical protein [Deinococcus puniceus]|uniref:hypothetical protein n=1 Tax=Deinococcus puniceus TaxID=1182568 RepID=UPI000ABEF47B|nr:hypothetical protein [Deinococcus puniceus]